MSEDYFITGTDTGAGKTWTTVALMRHLRGQGKTVLGMKPVASGCTLHDGEWKNDDALLLQRYASVTAPYAWVNPYALQLPAAPHIAAQRAGIDIDFETIGSAFRHLQAQADCILVEGVGGWAVPLNAGQDVGDLAKFLALPVIIAVGMRLGCINHARLTYRAVAASGVSCRGWVAVCIDPNMTAMEENIATLQTTIDTPLLGVLPHSDTVDRLPDGLLMRV
ncbi:MAG: dethiobiotin synthase [Gammaproteobacteria bacterium]